MIRKKPICSRRLSQHFQPCFLAPVAVIDLPLPVNTIILNVTSRTVEEALIPWGLRRTFEGGRISKHRPVHISGSLLIFNTSLERCLCSGNISIFSINPVQKSFSSEGEHLSFYWLCALTQRQCVGNAPMKTLDFAPPKSRTVYIERLYGIWYMHMHMAELNAIML